MFEDRPCAYCGKIIKDAWTQQKYHTECSVLAAQERRIAKAEANKEYQRNYQREYNAKKKAAKPARICKLCGNEIDNPENTKYCTSCQKEAKKAREMKQAEQLSEEIKGGGVRAIFKESAQAKPAKKKVQKGWCLDGKTADRVEIEARSIGLSMGKYSELIAHGTVGGMLQIERYLRSEGIVDGLERTETAWRDFKRQQRLHNTKMAQLDRFNI